MKLFVDPFETDPAEAGNILELSYWNYWVTVMGRRISKRNLRNFVESVFPQRLSSLTFLLCLLHYSASIHNEQLFPRMNFFYEINVTVKK